MKFLKERAKDREENPLVKVRVKARHVKRETKDLGDGRTETTTHYGEPVIEHKLDKKTGKITSNFVWENQILPSDVAEKLMEADRYGQYDIEFNPKTKQFYVARTLGVWGQQDLVKGWYKKEYPLHEMMTKYRIKVMQEKEIKASQYKWLKDKGYTKEAIRMGMGGFTQGAKLIATSPQFRENR